MSEATVRSVQIGSRDVTVARFRGLKAILAGALVARVMRELPAIQDRVTEYQKDYRKTNTVVITPAMARLPRFAMLGLTREDFETAGGTIEFPDEPTVQQTMIGILPDLFELARKEVMRFLALIAIPNDELERADDADEVETALDRQAKQLFRDGDIDQLLELAVVGWEVMEDQIMSKRDKLGKLLKLPFLRVLQSTAQEETDLEEEETAPEDQMEMDLTEEESTSPTSPPDVPSSSTDSEEPTDGTEEPLSTVSPGTS